MDEIIKEIQKKINLDDLISAAAVVDVYATGIIDLPVAYRFKSLDAIKLPGELSVGANFKYIQRIKARKLISLSASDVGSIEESFDAVDLAAVKGQGFGFDVGTIYHFTPEWNFGLQISDVFTQINYDTVLAKYPSDADDRQFTHTARILPEFNIGAAYTPEIIYYWKDKYFHTKNRFTFAVDFRDLSGNYEEGFINRLHIGAEYRFSPFALRVGLNKKYPAFGVGIELGGFQLTYAFYGDESYLAKALHKEKTVYYHEVLIAFKFGHHSGKAFGNDVKKDKPELEAKVEPLAQPAKVEAEIKDEVVEPTTQTPEAKPQEIRELVLN
jgi:hypothetical protein